MKKKLTAYWVKFYSDTHCTLCGAEEAKGNAHLADDELEKPCVGNS